MLCKQVKILNSTEQKIKRYSSGTKELLVMSIKSQDADDYLVGVISETHGLLRPEAITVALLHLRGNSLDAELVELNL